MWALKNKENVLSFSQRIKLLAKGYALMHRMTPGMLRSTLIATFVTALQPMLVLFFSARIINELAGQRSVEVITRYVALTVGISFGLSVIKTFMSRTSSVSQSMAFFNLSLLQAEKYSLMDYGHTEDSALNEKLADLEAKARGNGLGMINLYHFSEMLIQNFFALVFAGILLVGMFSSNAVYEKNFATSPWANLILLGLLGLLIAVALIYRKKEEKVLGEIFSKNQKANTAAWYYNSYLKPDEAAKDIRLFNQSSVLARIFKESYGIDNWLRFFTFGAKMNGANSAMLALLAGAVYIIVGLRALAGMYDLGNVLQYSGAITAAVTATGLVTVALGRLYNNAEYVKPMLEYLNLPDTFKNGTLTVTAATANDYQIEFKNVSFRYPGSSESALKDLNLKLNIGQRLAVVGLNGSGKTTMIKLLCRLYDPTEGEILLNGKNIKEYDYPQYHQLFSVVFQDFQLFPLELGQNVASAKDFDKVNAERCLQDAGFGQRLEKMTAGLETMLYKSYDEEGVQVSGGEAQKIALARALYKNAPIVVLDEPTAALDPIAEFEVYSTFDKTIGEKTAVFISHRLSSCRFCHDIAVFESGRLVQRGSHETLVADTSGLYCELWNAQAKHYTGEVS